MYKQVFKNELRDCPSALKVAETATFSRKSLIKVVNKYNECFGIKTQVVVNTLHRSKLYVGLGFYFLSPKATSLGSFKGFNEKNLQSSPSLFLQYKSGGVTGLNISVGAYRMSYEYTANASAPFPNDNGNYTTDYFNYDLKYSSLVVPISLENSFFNNGKVHPYIGLSLGFYFNGNFSGTQYRRIGSPKAQPTQSNTEDGVAKVKPWFRIQSSVNFDVGAFIVGGGVFFKYMPSPFQFQTPISDKISIQQQCLGLKVSVAYAFVK